MQLEYGCNRRGYIRGIELRTSRWCSGYAVDAVANVYVKEKHYCHYTSMTSEE